MGRHGYIYKFTLCFTLGGNDCSEVVWVTKETGELYADTEMETMSLDRYYEIFCQTESASSSEPSVPEYMPEPENYGMPSGHVPMIKVSAKFKQDTYLDENATPTIILIYDLRADIFAKIPRLSLRQRS